MEVTKNAQMALNGASAPLVVCLLLPSSFESPEGQQGQERGSA